MTNKDPLLAQGIAAAKSGDRDTARALLTRAVRLQPDSEMAWLWLSSVLRTPQGRVYCLREVLELNPENGPARRGLAALEKAQPAPAVTALATPPPPPPLSPPPPPPQEALVTSAPAVRPWEAVTTMALSLDPGRLLAKPRFWQGVVAVLGTIALAMAGVLAYATLGLAGSPDEETLVAAIAPVVSPSPAGTLRPTYTATATDTPAPTDTPTPTDTPSPTATLTPVPTNTPLPTETPLPTNTPMPAATATRRPRRQAPTATPTAVPPPAPRAELPPRKIDPRLAELGVRVEPAFVGPGQRYWRLVEARWANEQESEGRHSVFVEAQNLNGQRALGQTVIFQWADGRVTLPIQDRAATDWGVDFGMYNCLGSYSVYVAGAPSDRMVGMGLGTAETPYFTVHTSFYLTFRLVQR